MTKTSMTPGAEAARATQDDFLTSRVPLYQQRIEQVLARALDIPGAGTARLLEAIGLDAAASCTACWSGKYPTLIANSQTA